MLRNMQIYKKNIKLKARVIYLHVVSVQTTDAKTKLYNVEVKRF
jgi:hypothetical protein